jgi:hypothetical protein
VELTAGAADQLETILDNLGAQQRINLSQQRRHDRHA